MRIVARLGFGRRDVSDRLQQPPVVEPVDLLQRRELDRLEAAPRPAAVDELLEGYEKPEDLLGDEGLLKGLQKALMEGAFGAELAAHLGYEKGDPGGRGSGNNRRKDARKLLPVTSGKRNRPSGLVTATSVPDLELQPHFPRAFQFDFAKGFAVF